MTLSRRHVVSFLTCLAGLAVSCDGCGPPVDNPDGGVGPDAGAVPAPTTLALNEVMSRNGVTVQDAFGEFDDWLELFNLTDEPLDLAGFTLADSASASTPFPNGATVPANGFLLVFLDDGQDTQSSLAEPHFPFKLAGEGDTLFLRDGDDVVDAFTIPALELDVAFGRNPDGAGAPVVLGAPTPGGPNSAAEGEGEGEGEGENCASTVVVNEVLAENVAAFPDPIGELEAWVELYNAGVGPAALLGLSLATDVSLAGAAPLPARTLAPDEYLVVFLDGDLEQDGAHVALTIDGTTPTLVLGDACGQVVHATDLALGAPDVSVGIAPGGSADEAPVALSPTPGEPNAL